MKKSIFNRNVNLMLLISFLYLTCPMLINPLLTGFTQSLGASALTAGIIVSVMNFVSLVLRPISGNLTDRFSKYHLTMIGSGLLFIAGFGYIFAWSSTWLIFVRIVHGVGYALCSVCVSTWMASLLPRDRVGFGMGIYGMTNALAMALAPALGIFLYQRFSYRLVFIIMTFLAATLLLTIQFVTDRGLPVVHHAPPTAAEPATTTTSNQHPKRHMKLVQPRVVPVAVIILLFSIPYFATQSYIVNYVHDMHLHVAIGLFFPIYAAILLIMRFGLRDYFDRISFGYFLVAALLFGGVGLLAFSHMTSNLMMVIAALGLAGSYGMMFSICQSTALLLAPMHEQGLANSTFYIGLDIGMAIGPIMGGWIYGALPLHDFYLVMMLVLPIIAVVFVFTHKRLHIATQA